MAIKFTNFMKPLSVAFILDRIIFYYKIRPLQVPIKLVKFLNGLTGFWWLPVIVVSRFCASRLISLSWALSLFFC